MRDMFLKLGGLFALLFITTPLKAADGKDRISSLFAKASAKTVLSVHVQRMSDGATLYELKPDQLVCPASVTKLVTAGATLANYSPHHLFMTRVYSSGSRAANGV